MKKKLIMMAVAVVVAFCASADTETVGGYTWTYRINGDTAEIYNNGSRAISPSPIGAVTIPFTLGGKPVTSIGEMAFYNCSGLTSVTIGKSVTSIGEHSFFGCSALASVTIPDSVTSIGGAAFYNCNGLTSVTIPDSVTSIGDRAFEGCNNWNETIINISDVAAWCTNAINNRLQGQKRLFLEGEEVFDLQIPAGVTSIGSSAFFGCSSLTSVTMPDSVTSIGSGAFSGCSGLTGVMIPDSVTSIGDWAFYGCSGLTSVTIPQTGVDSFIFVFSGYNNLALTISESVTSIGPSAFEDCIGLASVTIGNSVTSIGVYAFYNCSGLTSVTIGNSVTSIGGWAFKGCSSLTSVTIPDSVTDIGDRAFYGCSSLTSVTIPDNVTSIGVAAFYGCSGLTSVTIPNSVTNIGDSAFRGCNSIRNVLIPQYVCSSTVQAVFPYAYSSMTNIIVSDAVTIIGNQVFSGCSSLISVVVPNSVTNIGDAAFQGCSGLTNVTIPNSVTNIGSYAFRGCSRLTAFYVSENNQSYKAVNGLLLSKDGKTLIAGVNGDVTIPDSVTSIGYSAFSYCSGLTSVTIPDSVTNIGERAFYNCSGLTSVTIPDSVTSIANYAFSACRGLTSFVVGSGNTNYMSVNGLLLAKHDMTLVCGVNGDVVIPNSVTSIGSYAFRGCSRLTSVTIPDSVTNIGDYAFYGCSSLTNIVFEGSAPDIGEDIFVNVNPECTVYVRPGTTGWGVDIPGTWNGLKIEYAEVLPPQVTVEINGMAVGFETAEDGRTRTAAVAAGTAAEDVKVIVGGVDVTAGFNVSVEGTTATISLAEPVVGVAPEAAGEVAKDEDDPSGMLVEVAPAKIAAKPEPKSGEAVGALPVKACEGLYYQAAWGSDVTGLTTGEKVKATGPSLYLGVIKQTGEKGFYKLTVSEK